MNPADDYRVLADVPPEARGVSYDLWRMQQIAAQQAPPPTDAERKEWEAEHPVRYARDRYGMKGI